MSRHTERDDEMDALLRRTWRGTGGDLPASCPDAGSLAAFADASLSTAEHESVAAHAAACERCQAVLAALARTEGVVPGGSDPPRPRSWWHRFAAPRWAVPLSAAATAVALYVAGAPGREHPVAGPGVSPPVVARAEPPAGPARDDAPRLERKEEPAPPPLPGAGPARTPRQEAAPPAPAETAPREAGGGRAKASGDTHALADASSAPSSVPDAAAEKVGGTVAAAPPVSAPQPAAPAPPPAPELQGFADRSATRGTGDAAFTQRAPGALDVRAPDGRERWRVANGRIEHSLDNGATWTAADLAGVAPSVPAALVAGVSPAPGVCWMAGGNGLVLRTTNGTDWEAVAFPERTTLVAIAASSASAATVRDAAGRTWTTGDGGVHWEAARF